MRTTEIADETLEYLYAERFPEAVRSFRETCDKYPDCEYIVECTYRCLLPELRHMSLSADDEKVERIIAGLLGSWLVDDLREN